MIGLHLINFLNVIKRLYPITNFKNRFLYRMNLYFRVCSENLRKYTFFIYTSIVLYINFAIIFYIFTDIYDIKPTENFLILINFLNKVYRDYFELI